MSDSQRQLPAYALSRLEADETVGAVGRFHWTSSVLYLVMAVVLLAVVVFSLLVEPGFIRMAVLPAIPFVAGAARMMLYGPALILVTNRRVLVVRRFLMRSVSLDELRAVKVRRGPLARLLGYGRVVLMDELHSSDPDEARFATRLDLEHVRCPTELAAAVVAAARALGVEVALLGKWPGEIAGQS